MSERGEGSLASPPCINLSAVKALSRLMPPADRIITSLGMPDEHLLGSSTEYQKEQSLITGA